MLCSNASAQRTMHRQSAPSLAITRNDTNIGGEILYNQYTLTGFWNAGIRASDYVIGIDSYNSLEAIQLTATTSYMARALSTRSRRLNLYGGGGIFMGYEFIDPFERLPDYFVVEGSRGCFVYGIHAKTEIEFFITRQIALIGTASVPINFQSQTGWFHWEAGIGIRINI